MKKRHPGRDMLAVLERIEKLGSLENIRQHAIENLVRTVGKFNLIETPIPALDWSSLTDCGVIPSSQRERAL